MQPLKSRRSLIACGFAAAAEFHDRTADLGLELSNSQACWIDVDRDGWTDLYLASDFGRDDLYLNREGKRFERTAGREAILAVEETMNQRGPLGDRAEHQGAVRDRLVARDADAALEGAATAGGQRREGGR